MGQLSPSQRAERALAPLRLSKQKLDELQEAFENELIKGLEMHLAHGSQWQPQLCSFRMLDSCVSSIPTGEEKGFFYALDFGGTNVRAVRCEMKGQGKIAAQQAIKNLADCGGDVDLMSPDTSASQLFDALADCIEELIKDNKDSQANADAPSKLGFTFSFPCIQTALDTSILEAWTKGFATGHNTKDPVVGRDVVALLTDALRRKGLKIECAAVVNDTVGTLLSCAYQKKPGSPPCVVGVILGTGANCCYVEPEASNYGYKGCIVNVECGNFNKKLPQTEADKTIDAKSPNKGQQLLEKMISGFYLGELMRLLVVDIFGDKAPAKTKQEFSIDTEQVAVLASACIPGVQPSATALDKCVATIKKCWDWDVNRDGEEMKILRDVAFAVFDRSAALAAISIAAMVDRTKCLENDGSATIAVDGSLYVKNHWYGDRIREYMKQIMGEKYNRLILNAADDGSGKGAAICVAALH